MATSYLFRYNEKLHSLFKQLDVFNIVDVLKPKFNELHSVINGRSSLTDELVVFLTEKCLLKLNTLESVLNIPVSKKPLHEQKTLGFIFEEKKVECFGRYLHILQDSNPTEPERA